MNKLVMAALVVASVSSAWAIQGTIYTEVDSKTGDIKWQPRSKSYAVSYKKGQTNVSAEFPLSDVTRLDIPKPAGFDKAIESVRRGAGAAAIGPLSKIVQEYRMLEWDKPAGRYLVEAYLAANNAQKALDTAQAIINDDKASAWSGDLAPAYWRALLKLGKTQILEANLKKAATSGSRPASAEALIMRGDMILAAGGESSESFRSALTDGYLRVALMYIDEDCRQVRADAMNKAAHCLDKLGMAQRAENLRSEAKKL